MKEPNVEYELKFFNSSTNFVEMHKIVNHNKDKIGYVRVVVPMEKPAIFTFVEGKFKRSEFIDLERSKHKMEEDEKHHISYWGYFEILWEYNHTVIRIKELYTIFLTSNYDKFKLRE